MIKTFSDEDRTAMKERALELRVDNGEKTVLTAMSSSAFFSFLRNI